MSFVKALWQQIYPPPPRFTEKNVSAGSHVGKVFIVTGANQGVGLALVKHLYHTGATIYMAGRSLKKIQAAIDEVNATSPAPSTPAILKPLELDLLDLGTIRPAAASFAAQESRLDVLWNNAGATFPANSSTKQGFEAHAGSHCVAPLLFTQELLPLLQAAVPTAPKDSVRVVWTGSAMIQTMAPKGGVDFTRLEKPTTKMELDYSAAKSGNYFLTVEGARRWGKDGIISVCQNPGQLSTSMNDRFGKIMGPIVRALFLYPAKTGAYTLLYAGLSPEVNQANNGAYIWPFGKIKPVPNASVHQAVADGKARDFWDWCESSWRKHA